MSSFTFADIFAGIGGFRLALEGIGGTCLATCERDKFARKTYEANFGEINQYRWFDEMAHSVDTMPFVDVVAAGFPCQPFSKAGTVARRQNGIPDGFDDPHSGVAFHHLWRYIDRIRPAALLLENVPRLLTHDNGRSFETVVSALQYSGYHLRYQVVDARSWVPQTRQRLFIVGVHRMHYPNPEPLEIELPSGPYPKLKDILEPESETTEACILNDGIWKCLQEHRRRHANAGSGFGYCIADPEGATRTMLARYYKDGAEILIGRPDGNPRRLTPRECARLQGFDTPEREWKIPVSRTQAYKQFGNAVCVPVATAVAKTMISDIHGAR